MSLGENTRGISSQSSRLDAILASAGNYERRALVSERDKLTRLLSECRVGTGDGDRCGPIRYAVEVLHFKPFEAQRAILAACTQPPYRIAVGSGQNLGKSVLCAVIVNWRYDCWNLPGGNVTTTTGPTKQSVVDILWREIRTWRMRACGIWPELPMDLYPSAPRMQSGSEDHWAAGLVATGTESFKGRHLRFAAWLFDEAVRIMQHYFIATKGMFQPGGNHLWVCGYNPTDPSCPLYQELERNAASWRVFSLSCLEHPNVVDHLEGRSPGIPSAVTYEQISDAVLDFCEPILDATERQADDFAWPPVKEDERWTTHPQPTYSNCQPVQMWRAGPEFQGGWQGVWPTGGPHKIWPEALWQAVTIPAGGPIPGTLLELPQIGIDTATTGDHCSFHVRWGTWSVKHVTKHGIRPTAIKGQAIELVREAATWVNLARQQDNATRPMCKPQEIPIVIDDDGVGRSVCDFLREEGFLVVAIHAATQATLKTRYPNKRSELWFQTRDKAYAGLVHLGRLPRRMLDTIKRQFVSVQWELDSPGRRVVEEKVDTVKRIGRSPDDADSINLAYYDISSIAPQWVPSAQTPGLAGNPPRNEKYRGLFGTR